MFGMVKKTAGASYNTLMQSTREELARKQNSYARLEIEIQVKPPQITRKYPHAHALCAVRVSIILLSTLCPLRFRYQVAAMRVRLDEIYRIRGFIISPTSGFMDVWDFFLILGLIYTSVRPVSVRKRV